MKKGRWKIGTVMREDSKTEEKSEVRLFVPSELLADKQPILAFAAIFFFCALFGKVQFNWQKEQ